VIKIGSGYPHDDFADVLANSYQVGSNVEYWLGSDRMLTIMGYDKSNLTAANFDFS